MAINVDRDKRERKDGKGRVRITIYRGGKLIRAPLEVHVKGKDWDLGRKIVKSGEPLHMLYNRSIASALSRARTAAAEHPEWSSEQIRDFVLSPNSSGVTLAQACQTVLTERASRFAPQTRERLGFVVQMIEEALPLATLSGLTSSDVSKYREHIHKRKVGQNTLRSRIKLLRVLYRHACSHYSVEPKNVFAGMIPRELETQPRYLHIDEVQMLAEAKLTGATAFARDVFLLAMFLGGMRFGDLHRLKVSQIEGNAVRMTQGKSKVPRIIPIIPAAKDLLSRYSDGERVLPMTDRLGSANATVNEGLKRAAHAAGVNTAISTHWARHTFANWAINNGVDVNTVSKILGHRDLKTTMVYLARFDKRAVGAAFDKLAEAFGRR